MKENISDGPTYEGFISTVHSDLKCHGDFFLSSQPLENSQYSHVYQTLLTYFIPQL